jgi:hypothetical protein
MNNFNYMPFNEEWKKNVLRMKKKDIVDLAARIGIENIKLNNLLDIFKARLDSLEKKG